MPIPPPPVYLADLPAGWARSQTASAEVTQRAIQVLNTTSYRYGDGEVVELGGKTLAFRIEPHYDDHVDGILRWHRGVSVWERVDPAAPMPDRLVVVSGVSVPATLDERDVVISWDFAPVPAAVQRLFTRPTLFLTLTTPPNREYKAQVEALSPAPVRALLRMRSPAMRPLRVAVLGFSESCQGVRSFLSSGDGGRLDSVIAIDGVHANYAGDPAKGLVDANYLAMYSAFARLALESSRTLVVTHSSIKTYPAFVSTTDTAKWIWRNVTGGDETIQVPAELPDLSIPPTTVQAGSANPQLQAAIGPVRTVSYPTAPMQDPKRVNNFVILGYDDLDAPRGTADHIYQATAVLPMVLTQFLAAKWNAQDPKSGSCYYPTV